MAAFGNNSLLVKNVLRSRWWLSLCEQKSNNSVEDAVSQQNVQICWTPWIRPKTIEMLQPAAEMSKSPASGSKPAKRMIYSKVANNHLLSNKKNMLINLRKYFHFHGNCVFELKIFPVTFLLNRRNYAHQLKVIELYASTDSKVIWICKPGENSNQGQGITIEKNIEQLKERVKQFVKFADTKALDHASKNLILT